MKMKEIMNVVVAEASGKELVVTSTDVTTAKAGDVLDLGLGSRYRFMLLSRTPSPERQASGDPLWRVWGHRWIATRKAFTQSAIGFLVPPRTDA